MRFWDSSAIVPLLCLEESSADIRELYREDSDVVVWAFTRAETLSALCRRFREGSLSRAEFAAAKARLRSIRAAWSEVIDYERVVERAERLLELHPLSAADSLQLAAGIVSVHERTTGFRFVTLDERLSEAAGREGFTVEGPGGDAHGRPKSKRV